MLTLKFKVICIYAVCINDMDLVNHLINVDLPILNKKTRQMLQFTSSHNKKITKNKKKQTLPALFILQTIHQYPISKL